MLLERRLISSIFAVSAPTMGGFGGYLSPPKLTLRKRYAQKPSGCGIVFILQFNRFWTRIYLFFSQTLKKLLFLAKGLKHLQFLKEYERISVIKWFPQVQQTAQTNISDYINKN